MMTPERLRERRRERAKARHRTSGLIVVPTCYEEPMWPFMLASGTFWGALTALLYWLY